MSILRRLIRTLNDHRTALLFAGFVAAALYYHHNYPKKVPPARWPKGLSILLKRLEMKNRRLQAQAAQGEVLPVTDICASNARAFKLLEDYLESKDEMALLEFEYGD